MVVVLDLVGKLQIHGSINYGVGCRFRGEADMLGSWPLTAGKWLTRNGHSLWSWSPGPLSRDLA